MESVDIFNGIISKYVVRIEPASRHQMGLSIDSQTGYDEL